MSVRVRPPELTIRPTVTVVVPNYNYGAYLPAAVGSALQQDGVDVDVIVVDDCSDDGSAATVREMADLDARVTLIEHAKNLRHIATYNDGLARARGTYVVLMSADDALAPGALLRATRLMEAEPSIGLVYGHPRDFSSDSPPSESEPLSWPNAELNWTKWPGPEWIEHMCRRGRNMVRSPEVVMRTDVLRDLGGQWDARFPHSADMYLWMRAAAHSDVGRVNGRVQAYYRVHAANMHLTEFGGLLDDFIARRDTYDAFFAVDGARLPGARRLNRLWRRWLAREALRQIAYLPLGSERAAEARELYAFATELAPGDRAVRSFYRFASSDAIVPVWFRVEAQRTYRRDQHELKVGT
ncbi:glycosyltransferase family 2 protein [Microbacterium sp. Root61]|uniref:glycosyltransferase family 2 protein n=1 Tax=Microbacterium sp. Root61 TaxID=1736570 RepID=UPI0009E9300F|nr:glycosyltransferase family 2 protein [Microbacterium sp. Root61]